ncbi:putative methyltransferase [Candidatus Moduliflexus flocculans]|uniref:Putative methyltransferase n=1 Tax=Candidatus Moduliflexus flocculans TaxID=1499966 RepID=A0A0S6W015_9BACT|nr:putative methyltransferase [Candidatus Moduliflexus flocculans]
MRQEIPKPAVLKDIPYHYCRYGMPEELFCAMLRRIPRPDAVLVTSMMTYWYPGVARAIELVKQLFPTAPVALGGVYASLCCDHAVKTSGADYVIAARDPNVVVQAIDQILGVTSQAIHRAFPQNTPLPAYDLYSRLESVSLLTSIGCPYRCAYCASAQLSPAFVQRSPDAVFNEIRHYVIEKDIRNIAFYDDALLVNAQKHLEPILEQIIDARLACAFHTPNGLHARYISERLAQLMFRAGFQSLRIGLETVDAERQQRTGGKVTNDQFRQAVKHLKDAGFGGHQIGVYVFVGLPGQSLEETEATIRVVNSLGVLALLCEYSPIPGTPAYAQLAQEGHLSADDDPLLQNNTIFLYLKERHTFEQIQRLKDLTRTLNAPIKAGRT